MTAAFPRRRLTISVGQRLFLGLLPALLAVVLVIALFYYGQFGRSAPELVLIAAAALSVISLVGTWLNVRYVSGRVLRLAGSTSALGSADHRSPSDEFDRIEQVVDHLGSALSVSEAERARADLVATRRLREHAIMLAAAVRDTMAQLDEIRLPLHILLESRFGDLNENQEELLRDGRNAADAIDLTLRRLGQVADVDREALPVQRELVQVNDVVRAVLPLAHAAAERRGARVDTSLEPGLPRVMADRTRLAEALTLLITEAAGCSDAEQPLRLSTTRDEAQVAIEIAPLSPDLPRATCAASARPDASGGELGAEATAGNAGAVILADRLIVAQGASLERAADRVRVHLGRPPVI